MAGVVESRLEDCLPSTSCVCVVPLEVQVFSGVRGSEALSSSRVESNLRGVIVELKDFPD